MKIHWTSKLLQCFFLFCIAWYKNSVLACCRLALKSILNPHTTPSLIVETSVWPTQFPNSLSVKGSRKITYLWITNSTGLTSVVHDMIWALILYSVIVCCCFVGYAQHIRDELSEINILQNLQMARLCDIAGKNVKICTLCTNFCTHGNFEMFHYRPQGWCYLH